jgi:hypothetical protein
MMKFSYESEVVKLFWVVESAANVMMKNSLMTNWHKKKFDSKFLLLIQTSKDTNLSVSAISLSRIGEWKAALSFPLALSHCVSLHLFLHNWRISSKKADLSLSSSLSTKLEKFQQASSSLSLSLPSSLSPKLENFQQASRSLSLSLSLALSCSCISIHNWRIFSKQEAAQNELI